MSAASGKICPEWRVRRTGWRWSGVLLRVVGSLARRSVAFLVDTSNYDHPDGRMLKFGQQSTPSGRRRSSAAGAVADGLPPSPTRTALALSALTQLFPDASPAFLTWAIQHHLRPASGPGTGGAGRSPMGIQELVDRVGEKVLDGLGELYPRRRPEEGLSEEGRSHNDRRLAESTRVAGLNDDLSVASRANWHTNELERPA